MYMQGLLTDSVLLVYRTTKVQKCNMQDCFEKSPMMMMLVNVRNGPKDANSHDKIGKGH